MIVVYWGREKGPWIYFLYPTVLWSSAWIGYTSGWCIAHATAIPYYGGATVSTDANRSRIIGGIQLNLTQEYSFVSIMHGTTGPSISRYYTRCTYGGRFGLVWIIRVRGVGGVFVEDISFGAAREIPSPPGGRGLKEDITFWASKESPSPLIFKG